MVAPTCFRLAYIHKPCLAKPMLFAALACFEQGDLLGAGIRLREAVTRFLKHGCDWYGCMPQGKYPRPRDYVNALHKAGQLEEFGREVMLDIIEAGNKAAHCQKVDPHNIQGGISILFSFMDSQPWAGHERPPLVTSHKAASNCCDEDDCDSADWWKGGDV